MPLPGSEKGFTSILQPPPPTPYLQWQSTMGPYLRRLRSLHTVLTRVTTSTWSLILWSCRCWVNDALFCENPRSCTRHWVFCTMGWYWPTSHKVPRWWGGRGEGKTRSCIANCFLQCVLRSLAKDAACVALLLLEQLICCVGMQLRKYHHGLWQHSS